MFVVGLFTIIRAGQEIVADPFDVLFGRMYWVPPFPSHELLNIFTPVLNIFPVFPLITILFLLGIGLLCLAELEG